MTTALATTTTTTAAARAVDLTKVYGSGETAVTALDDVTRRLRPGRAHRHHGAVGVGQVDPAARDGRARLAHLGPASTSATPTSPASTTPASPGCGGTGSGFVFQAFNLLPQLTASENITLPLDLAGRKPDWAWIDEVVETVGLQARLTHKPAELSGGQQQRVAVARALASRPEIIFADEPTGNLDSSSGTEVLQFLRASVDDLGQTVVMVTHDAGAAVLRQPGAVPRRRPHRRRAGRAHRRAGARPPEDPGGVRCATSP